MEKIRLFIIGRIISRFSYLICKNELMFPGHTLGEWRNSSSVVSFLSIRVMNVKNIITILLIVGVLVVEISAETINHNGFTYGTVTSPYTGRVWLDRNLGAYQVCTAIDDVTCYGDYYQWGRNTDGHEKSNSLKLREQANDINNAGSRYRYDEFDWTSVDANGVARSSNWSKVDGTSVCPVGYKVPTVAELTNEINSSNVSNNIDAYNHFLKFPSAGWRRLGDGSMYFIGRGAMVWTVSWNTFWVQAIEYTDTLSTNFSIQNSNPAQGYSVRCIQDNNTTSNTFPTVNAGNDQFVGENLEVTLDGSLSSSSNSSIVSYEWKEGNTVLSNSAVFRKSDFSVGIHTINLTVTNETGNQASDEVIITVNARENLLNNVPKSSSISESNKKAFYNFTVTEPSIVKISFSDDTSFNTSGWVYNSNGNLVSTISNWNDGKNNQFYFEGLLPAGTYMFDLYSEDNSFGNYTVSLDIEAIQLVLNQTWEIEYKNSYSVDISEPFSIDLPVTKKSELTNIGNLTLTSSDNSITIEKSDNGYFKLKGNLSSSKEIEFILTDTTQSFEKRFKVSFVINEYSIKTLARDNYIFVNQLDDNSYEITNRLAVPFDAIVPSNSTLKCKVVSDNQVDVRVDLYVEKLSGNRYVCKNTAGSPSFGLEEIDNLSIKLYVEGNEDIFAYDTVKVYNRNEQTALAIIENMSGDSSYSTRYQPEYLIVNNTVYDSNSIPQRVYIDGTKGRRDSVIMVGGLWKITTQGHELLIGLNDAFSQPKTAFYSVDKTHSSAEDGLVSGDDYDDFESIITVAKNDNYDILLTQTNRFLEAGSIWTTPSDLDEDSYFDGITNRAAAPNWLINECDFDSPLSMADAGYLSSHPCAGINSDFPAGNAVSGAVRGTTVKIKKDANSYFELSVLEGGLDIKDGDILKTINTNEKYSASNSKVSTVTQLPLESFEKVALKNVATYSIESESLLHSLTINTNEVNAQYSLIGEYVQTGEGTYTTIKNITNGDYTLHFYPVAGKNTPNSIKLTFDNSVLNKELNVTYSPLLTSKQTFIERFYQNILNRTADSGGMNTWLDVIQNQSAAKVALGFFQSQEFINLGLSNEQFVDILYQTLFDRVADSGGRDIWLNQLNNGTSRIEVIYGFLNAQEFKNLADSFGVTQIRDIDQITEVPGYVNRFYNLVLNRSADEVGFNDWVSQLRAGTKAGGDIAKGFFNSQEYIQRGLDDSTFLDICYRAFFNREADAGGKNSWLSQIAQGATTDDILNGFIGSQEFIQLAASYGINP